MDARIGTLNSGKFYAYVNGYSNEPVMGTLEEVEIALGIREAAPMPVRKAKPETPTWDVLMTFQYPAWNEVNGIPYRGIVAESKSRAIKIARRQAEDDGHAVGGRGMYYFKATKVE